MVELRVIKILEGRLLPHEMDRLDRPLKMYTHQFQAYRNYSFYKMAELYDTLNNTDRKTIKRHMPNYVKSDTSSGSENDV